MKEKRLCKTKKEICQYEWYHNETSDRRRHINFLSRKGKCTKNGQFAEKPGISVNGVKLQKKTNFKPGISVNREYIKNNQF